jgi:hypothetical protein
MMRSSSTLKRSADSWQNTGGMKQKCAEENRKNI